MKVGDKVVAFRGKSYEKTGVIGYIGAGHEDVLGAGCSDIELNFFVLLPNRTWEVFLEHDLEEVV